MSGFKSIRWQKSSPGSNRRAASQRRNNLCRQEGFTLVEMIATISLLGILMAMATGGLTKYFSAKGLETSAAEVATQVREAQAMAVATGNTYRIDFNSSTSYTLQRRQGETWVNERGPMDYESDTQVSTSTNLGGDLYLEFFSRGTSEDGQLWLRNGSGNTKVVQVTGETVDVQIN